MSKFKVGDRVRIAKSSEYYDDSGINNPIHVDGKIIESYKEDNSNYSCIVNWGNGMSNVYRESDLELVSDTKPEFKVGNKVRILDDNSSYFEVGSEHVIEEAFRDTYRIGCYYFHDKHLELVEQKPEFKVGHGAICIKKTHGHNVGDVLLVDEITIFGSLRFEKIEGYYDADCFTPCPNPPLKHYKQRIAYALGADIELENSGGTWRKSPDPKFANFCKYRVATPDIHAEKREQLQAEIERLQSELDNLGGDL